MPKKIVCKICLINTTAKIKTLNNTNYLHICNHAVSQYIKKRLASLCDNNVSTNIHSNALQQKKKHKLSYSDVLFKPALNRA